MVELKDRFLTMLGVPLQGWEGCTSRYAALPHLNTKAAIPHHANSFSWRIYQGMEAALLLHPVDQKKMDSYKYISCPV